MAKDGEHTPLSRQPDRLTGLNTYIDGKMRRYSLLFTVNGGAFAIAKLLGEQQGGSGLGDLSLQAVAIGAVVFTCLMWLDIFFFGEMMRNEFFGGNGNDGTGIVEEMKRFWSNEKDNRDEPLVFGPQGKFVLGALCTLLILGWSLAAFGPTGAMLALVLVVIALRLIVWHRSKADSNTDATKVE
jgi:hypothetical protein